jgi:hypothetical protein
VKSRVTKEFRKLLEQLPEKIKDQAARAYSLWRSDAFHPSLQFKRVSRRQPIESVRIGIDYRALGLRQGDSIFWFWIGSHDEYEKMLKRL